MFEGIQRGLGEALKRLRGRGRLTEANIREGLQEVRKVLLDADVNFKVVQEFTDPSEQIVKIIYDELVALMGPVDTRIRFAKDRPTVLMLCGLQGQGKTTTAAKLALTLREQGRKPLLVAADLQRPAAVDQLKVLGQQINVPVYSEFPSTPIDVARNGVNLTKMDGDARGGAALSIREVTKVPIKFIGVGEKVDRLEEFRPEGMASRIIGQGDLMDVIGKVARAQADLTEEERKRQQEIIEKGQFTLDDFRKQFQQLQKMGPMKDLLKAMPG